MHPRYYIIEKKLSETPLQALTRLRKEFAVAKDISLAYAGRLDPMATGKLLVLIGDECKHQVKYHGLDKEYEFEILFGFETDTSDVLGIATANDTVSELAPSEVARKLKALIGTHSFPYPKFSAKTVRGKPLHMWTLEGRLGEIEIPLREMRVYTCTLIATEIVTGRELHARIFSKINSFPEVTDERKELGRDFRRADIRREWDRLLINQEEKHFLIARARATVSSGTYIRTLAAHIGAQLGTQSLAFSIHRTKIGRFIPFLSTGLWIKKYR